MLDIQIYYLKMACLYYNSIFLQFYQTRILQGKSYIQLTLPPRTEESGMKHTGHFVLNMVYQQDKYTLKHYYPKLFHRYTYQCKGLEKLNEVGNYLFFEHLWLIAGCQLKEERLLKVELQDWNSKMFGQKSQECRRLARLYEEQLWSVNEAQSVELEQRRPIGTK